MEINKGDIMLVNSQGIVAKAIHLGMNIKYWFAGKKGWRVIQNHSAIGIGNNKIIEAINRVVTINTLDNAYKDHKDTVLSIYSFDWDKVQLSKLDKTVKSLEGKRYQYRNFLQWTFNIFTFGKVWIGLNGVKARNSQYCHETVATCVYDMTSNRRLKERLIHNFFRNYWKISPNKMESFCKKFGKLEKVIHIN